MTVDDSNGQSGGGSHLAPIRVIRHGGLALGVGGAVIALVGGLVD